jgi:hypothetical protein
MVHDMCITGTNKWWFTRYDICTCILVYEGLNLDQKVIQTILQYLLMVADGLINMQYCCDYTRTQIEESSLLFLMISRLLKALY